MILKHIPQGAGFIIVIRSVFDADGLGLCDLYVVDVITVPDRLKNSVGETEYQDVLNGFLAEIVVYSIYLRFVKTETNLIV